MVPRLDELLTLARDKDGSSWEVLLDNKDSDIKVECKRSHRGFLAIRSSGQVKARPIDIWRLVNDGRSRPLYDNTCDEAYNIRKLGVNAY